MSTANIDEELIAFDGLISVGVHGTAVAPTSALSTLDPSWTDLGLTVDGVTRSEPTSRTPRRAWPRQTKLRDIVTEAAVRWVTSLVQASIDTIELFHGTEIDPLDGSLITNPGVWPQIAFLIDAIDSDGRVIREYAPTARVVEIGDQPINTTAGLAWPVTIEAEYDATLGGYTQRFFSDLAGS